MPKQIWPTDMFWFYVELFHLLLYKYFNGAGADADGGRTATADVVRGQQFALADVWVWPVPERTHTQGPAIVCQRKLENESAYC